MELTDEQKQQVREWAAEGATLSQIQERIREKFNLSMSYMDARILVGELEVKLAEKAEPVSSKGMSGTPSNADNPMASVPGKVSVTVDELTPPHALISGKATFSDGKRSDWYVDEMGRLALNPTEPGYRPSEQDLTEFQLQLRKLVQTRGL